MCAFEHARLQHSDALCVTPSDSKRSTSARTEHYCSLYLCKQRALICDANPLALLYITACFSAHTTASGCSCVSPNDFEDLRVGSAAFPWQRPVAKVMRKHWGLPCMPSKALLLTEQPTAHAEPGPEDSNNGDVSVYNMMVYCHSIMHFM
jgi:hypothetical protein